MFYAEVLFCMVVNLNSCLVAHDDRGPYENIQECHQRLEEMTEVMVQHGWIARGVRCREEEKLEIFTSYPAENIRATS